jgi:HEAT repeat protein
MGFDFQNFGIGLATGWATAYGVYRARRVIQSLRDGVLDRATTVRKIASRSANAVYLGDLVRNCERSHLAGRYANLSDVLVEPRFMPLPELVGYVEEITRSVFRVVPRVLDIPYMYAPYNVETMSISDLVSGQKRIAILGLPGSGRTSALHAIILWSLEVVTFATAADVVQQQLQAQENALQGEKKAEAIKRRLNVEQQARERLAKERGTTYSEDNLGEDKIQAFKNAMPMYVHLANVRIDPRAFGETIDPAEPLVRALQFQMSYRPAQGLPRPVYQRLSDGRAAVLIDGYDDLPEAERPAKLAWVKALMDTYPNAFYIITGPVQGHGAFSEIGFTPTFLRAWDDMDAEKLAVAWGNAYPKVDGTRRKPAPKPDERLQRKALSKTRTMLPVDTVLKFWGTFAEVGENADTWWRHVIGQMLKRHLSSKETLDTYWPAIAAAGALQVDHGFITPALFAETYPDLFMPVGAAPAPAKKTTELGEVTFEDAPPGPPVGKDGKPLDAATIEREKAQGRARFFKIMQDSGLLLRFADQQAGGRLRFRHAFMAAYAASLSLTALSGPQLAEVAIDPNPAWDQVLAYAAAHMPLDAAVEARLRMPHDVLYTPLLRTARWLSYSDGTAAWRENLLKQVANLLVNTSQYPLIRERAAAALISTADRSTFTLFRRAAKDNNTEVRRLAALGIGALKESDGLVDLEALLQDPNTEVQLSAGLALGAINSRKSLEMMVEALTSGADPLRKAIAEAFAAIPDEGYPVLFDAVQHDDMAVRRASVFGLRRIHAPWSLVAVYQAALEDEQWYVRSAGLEAFVQMSLVDANRPVQYPDIAELPWLEDWAKKQGKDSTPDALLAALNAQEPATRGLSASTLGQYGALQHAPALYPLLRDRDEGVRGTAHRALGDLQLAVGQSLPLPT